MRADMQPFVVAPHSQHEVVISSGDKFRVVVFGETDSVYRQRGEQPPAVLFCVHGAGMCSSSFYVLSTHLTQDVNTRSEVGASQGRFPFLNVSSSEPTLDNSSAMVRVVAYDMRCHGDSTFNGGEENLTLQVLIEDFKAVMKSVSETLFADTSHFYVLGHSLGGSVVANGLRGDQALMSIVAGVVLLDVVEGTARVSLKYMNQFLKNRPSQFKTVSEATQWFLQHGGMNSQTAAAVTVPELVKEVGDHYEWKSNLEAMCSVWSGWFDGLNDAFVSLSCPKILCLANTERLDVALTIAQMQGKFQFEVMGNGCGHYVMDDQPAILAEKLRRFIRRVETLANKLRASTRKSLEKARV
ncbi:hypothetical protein TRVL_01727 [Trypanosoma vivax]|nr:hypothetical protein TRVL_01727 [Trypanosoma vivax]